MVVVGLAIAIVVVKGSIVVHVAFVKSRGTERGLPSSVAVVLTVRPLWGGRHNNTTAAAANKWCRR